MLVKLKVGLSCTKCIHENIYTVIFTLFWHLKGWFERISAYCTENKLVEKNVFLSSLCWPPEELHMIKNIHSFYGVIGGADVSQQKGVPVFV